MPFVYSDSSLPLAPKRQLGTTLDFRPRLIKTSLSTSEISDANSSTSDLNLLSVLLPVNVMSKYDVVTSSKIVTPRL